MLFLQSTDEVFGHCWMSKDHADHPPPRSCLLYVLYVRTKMRLVGSLTFFVLTEVLGFWLEPVSSLMFDVRKLMIVGLLRL